MSNSKIHKVARKSATNFKQGYQASQSETPIFWLIIIIALAVLWVILSAMGVRFQ